MKGRFWKVANGVMLLLFVLSAAVQLNDPDPLVWIGIYTAAAAVCGFEIRRPLPAVVPMVLALIAFVWAGSLYLRVHDVPTSALFAEWEMRDLHIEEAREMYGLTIVGTWMIVIAGVGWARRRRTAGRADPPLP